MNKFTWNSYRTIAHSKETCLPAATAKDHASEGCIIEFEVRKTGLGWQTRKVQINGRHRLVGGVQLIDEAKGEALFATAAAN